MTGFGKEVFMRKRIALLLVMALMILLVPSCTNDEEDAPKKGKTRNGGTPTQKVTETPTLTEEPTPTEEPTGTPTPTPTVAPTEPPTPTKEPLPEIIEFQEDYPNKALLAFAEYLDEKTEKMSEEQIKSFRYGIFHLNHDETPELWWAEGGSHADTATLCIYDGKKVAELGSFGSFGSCRYRKHGNVVMSNYQGMGVSVSEFYMLNETSLLRAGSFTEQTMDTPDGAVTTWFMDDAECSQKVFEMNLKDWQPDSFDVIDYEKGYDLFVYTEDGYTYRADSAYYWLYAGYVSSYDEHPFMYGIPEDILEQLNGEWTLTGGEVEGWEWKAEEEGISGKWIFEPNGEAEWTENGKAQMNRMELVPERLWSDMPVWCVRGEDRNRPGYYNVVTILPDGTMVHNHISYSEQYSAVYYYKKK